MASEEPQFKIKGAASNKGSPPASSTPAKTTDEQDSDSNEQDNDQPDPTPVEKAEEAQGEKTAKKRKAEEIEPSEQDLLKEKYRWFKCPAPAEVYGPGAQYYTNADTQESRWEEPEEPYWIYNMETGEADEEVGLQQPKPKKSSIPDNYPGYIPSKHGDYDPNADYAKYHEQKRAEEEAQAQQATAAAYGKPNYEAAVALNRFTGHAQRSGLGPDRHTAEAKASRQMNAFFDVDAAANAHDGRSLKEERKAKKLSKKEIQQFNQDRKDKKRKKQLEFFKH